MRKNSTFMQKRKKEVKKIFKDKFSSNSLERCNNELFSAQSKIFNLCENISDSLNNEKKRSVLWKLYIPEEYGIFYEYELYLAAPCGCCKTLPYIRYDKNTSYSLVLDRFRFINYIDKKIRSSIDEYRNEYTIDLMFIFDEDSDFTYLKNYENLFKMDKDEVVKRFIDWYNKEVENCEDN